MRWHKTLQGAASKERGFEFLSLFIGAWLPKKFTIHLDLNVQSVEEVAKTGMPMNVMQCMVPVEVNDGVVELNSWQHLVPAFQRKDMRTAWCKLP
eukprot:650642-Lingulodinium_polyedra.AAC.1